MRDRSNQLMGFTNQLRTGGGNQMDCVWKSRIPSNGNGHTSYILGKLTPGENPFKIWGYVPYCQTNWTEIEKTRLHSVISSIILYINGEKSIMGIIYIMVYSYIYRIYVNMENIINIAGKFTGMFFSWDNGNAMDYSNSQ